MVVMSIDKATFGAEAFSISPSSIASSDSRHLCEVLVSKTFSDSEFEIDTLCDFLVAFGLDLSLTGPEMASGETGDLVPDSGAGFLPFSADLALCVKSGFEFLKTAFFGWVWVGFLTECGLGLFWWTLPPPEGLDCLGMILNLNFL